MTVNGKMFNELDQWRNDLQVYNEDYENIALLVKKYANQAYALVSEFKAPLTPIDNELLAALGIALSVQLQRLVDVRAEAAYNFRGTKNFYDRTVIGRKFQLMRGGGEKKIAANVAEGEAIQLSTKEFDIMNEAERYADISDKRWETTKELIASIRSKLDYGPKP